MAVRVSRVGLVLAGLYLTLAGGCLGAAMYSRQAGDIIAYKGWVALSQLALAPGLLFLMITRLEVLIRNTWLDNVLLPITLGMLFFYLIGSFFDRPQKPRERRT
ncbi:hypothetical protein C5L14_27785 [Labrys okinawensis]|uniref:Uncharacterized protein n=1 Tax=Labrys okinawensis TaxID=346911 RepID=A0A2S9Q4S2_9HYPH|nr:hypothetical protein [Labrys okinawensis]PRH84341.1 hypothetical protein C5L14_27785 [Labrys okinawensis]